MRMGTRTLRQALKRDVHREWVNARIALIRLSSAHPIHQLKCSYESRRGMEAALRMKRPSSVQLECARWSVRRIHIFKFHGIVWVVCCMRQAEFVQHCERKDIFARCHDAPRSGILGMMEAGSCHGQYTRRRLSHMETRGIVDEVGDDHFQKFVRKSTCLAIHHNTCPVQNPESESCGLVQNGVGQLAAQPGADPHANKNRGAVVI